MVDMGTGQISIWLTEQNRKQIKVLLAHYGQVTIASVVRLLIQEKYESLQAAQKGDKHADGKIR